MKAQRVNAPFINTRAELMNQVHFLLDTKIANEYIQNCINEDTCIKNSTMWPESVLFVMADIWPKIGVTNVKQDHKRMSSQK